MESESLVVLEGSNGEGAELKTDCGNGPGFNGLNPNSVLGRPESRPSLLDSALRGNSDADSEVAAMTATPVSESSSSDGNAGSSAPMQVAGSLSLADLPGNINALGIHLPFHNLAIRDAPPHSSYAQSLTPLNHPLVRGRHPPVPGYEYSPYPQPYSIAQSQMMNHSWENPVQNPYSWGHRYNPYWCPQCGRQIVAHKGFAWPVQHYNGSAPGFIGFNPGWCPQCTRQGVAHKSFARPVQAYSGTSGLWFRESVLPGHRPDHSESYRASRHNMPTSPSHPEPHPAPPSDMTSLQNRIVLQIEYYFCEENLVTDFFLRSLFDVEGWVPISRIADFNRIRRMKVSNEFILHALQRSEHIEVQGDKIRKRVGWSKWCLPPN